MWSKCNSGDTIQGGWVVRLPGLKSCDIEFKSFSGHHMYLSYFSLVQLLSDAFFFYSQLVCLCDSSSLYYFGNLFPRPRKRPWGEWLIEHTQSWRLLLAYTKLCHAFMPTLFFYPVDTYHLSSLFQGSAWSPKWFRHVVCRWKLILPGQNIPGNFSSLWGGHTFFLLEFESKVDLDLCFYCSITLPDWRKEISVH